MRIATQAFLVLLVAALVATRRKPSSHQASKVIFQFVDMDTCPETVNQNITVSFRYMQTGDVYADTGFSVITPAQSISKIRLIARKCHEDGSDCEHFMNVNSPMDGCAAVAAKKMLWTPCFEHVRPFFLCPIAATRYFNYNWTVDKDMLSLLPVPRNHLYKFRVEMRNEKEELFWCLVFHAKYSLFKPRT